MLILGFNDGTGSCNYLLVGSQDVTTRNLCDPTTYNPVNKKEIASVGTRKKSGTEFTDEEPPGKQ